MEKKINPDGFEAFLQKAFKLSAEDVASLYNEAGELTDFSLIERKDAERISKLSTDKQNQYNRGLKEASIKIEKDLKEKYNVESELIGSELFDFIVESKLSEVQKADPAEVMKHPEVIKALNEKDKAIKLKDKEKEEALKAIRSEIEHENLFKEVETSALAEFENLNPILPADAKKAQALKKILIDGLKKNKYQKVDNEYIVLKEDGTQLQDQHGNSISFQDHVKGQAETYFDFKKAEDRNSSGNNNQTGQTGTKKIRMPKDEADYVSIMKDQTLTPQERVEIKNLWVNKK